jgi:LysM domain.
MIRKLAYKIGRFILLMVLLLTLTACNLPVKVLWYTPNPTLDPAIFEQQHTPQFSQQTPEAPSVPTSQALFPYDPNVSVSYIAQSGDTLAVVAKHFGVSPDQISSPNNLPQTGLLPPGQQLIIPRPQERRPLC